MLLGMDAGGLGVARIRGDRSLEIPTEISTEIPPGAALFLRSTSVRTIASVQPREMTVMNIRRKRHGRLSALGLTLLFAVLIATGIVVGIGGRVLWESREPGKPDVCAFLHVSPCESTLLASDARPPSEREFEIYKNTQRQLVKSPVVLTAALADSAVNRLPSLQREGPVAWLAEELEVSFPGDAEIMLIGMSGHDPKESVAIVNAVVSA